MPVTTDNLKTLLSEETTGLQVPADFESKFKGKEKYANRDMVVQAAKEGIIDQLPPIYKKTIIEKAAAEINRWTDAEFPKDKSDSGKIAVLYLYTILTGKSQDPNVDEVLKVGRDLRTETEEIKKVAAERAAVPKIETIKIKKIDATSAIPPIIESGSKASTPTVLKAKNKTISRKQITKEFNEVGELVNFTKTKEGKEKGTRKDILVTTAINSVEADTDDIIRALTISKTKEITENPANPQEAQLVTSLETNKLLDNYTIIRKGMKVDISLKKGKTPLDKTTFNETFTNLLKDGGITNLKIADYNMKGNKNNEITHYSFIVDEGSTKAKKEIAPVEKTDKKIAYNSGSLLPEVKIIEKGSSPYIQPKAIADISKKAAGEDIQFRPIPPVQSKTDKLAAFNAEKEKLAKFNAAKEKLAKFNAKKEEISNTVAEKLAKEKLAPAKTTVNTPPKKIEGIKKLSDVEKQNSRKVLQQYIEENDVDFDGTGNRETKARNMFCDNINKIFTDNGISLDTTLTKKLFSFLLRYGYMDNTYNISYGYNNVIGNSYLETETNKKLETAVKDSINIIKNEKIVNIQDNQSIAYGANNRPLDNK